MVDDDFLIAIISTILMTGLALIGDALGEGGYAHSKLKKRGKSPLFYGIKII